MRTRILLLNDDPDTLARLAKALDSDGYEVAAHLGHEVAPIEVTEIHPQLIILDVESGSESRGIELMQLVWLVPALRNVQFLLTASISQRIHAMENTLRTKGIGVLYKPYTVDQLRESVHTQLRTDAARR